MKSPFLEQFSSKWFCCWVLNKFEGGFILSSWSSLIWTIKGGETLLSAGVGENLQVGILGYTKIVQHVGQQVMMGKVILNPFTVQRAWGAGLGRVECGNAVACAMLRHSVASSKVVPWGSCRKPSSNRLSQTLVCFPGVAQEDLWAELCMAAFEQPAHFVLLEHWGLPWGDLVTEQSWAQQCWSKLVQNIVHFLFIFNYFKMKDGFIFLFPLSSILYCRSVSEI